MQGRREHDFWLPQQEGKSFELDEKIWQGVKKTCSQKQLKPQKMSNQNGVI
jgi:hypothetical protein